LVRIKKFSFFLTIFLVDENADLVENLINFHKQKLVYNIVTDTLKSVKVGYDVVPSDDLSKFLEKLPALTEKELYEQSLLREPRNATRADIK
jgi:hypothetical protein